MSGTRKRRTKPTAPRKKIQYMWQFQEAIAPLIDEWLGGMVPFPNRCGFNDRSCYHELTFDQVVQAVAVMTACLNFGGGSGLYELIGTLVMDEPMRDKIEALLATERKNGWVQILYGHPPRINPARKLGSSVVDLDYSYEKWVKAMEALEKAEEAL